MNHLRTDLNDSGILIADGLFSASQIKSINSALDPHFTARHGEKRSYANAAELIALGVMDDVLNDAVVSSFFAIMDDPKMYQFTVFEISAGSNAPHVAEANFNGWHRDHDSEYNPVAPSHISLFTYLSDVGVNDGAFEFMPHTGTGKFCNNSDAVAVRGETGTSFFWNRHFFHRASPNRGTIRRRVLKFSIQNAPSEALDSELRTVAIHMAAQDDKRRSLFGHPTQGNGQTSHCPQWTTAIPQTNIQVNLSRTTIAKAKLKQTFGLLDSYSTEVGTA